MTEFFEKISELLKAGEPREAVAQNVLTAVLREFNSETGTVHWLDKEKNLLKLAAQAGLPDVVIEQIQTIPVGKGIAGETVARGQPISICNLQSDQSGVARPGAKASGVGGMICVPIRYGETIVGAFGIGTMRAHKYTAEETDALEDIGRLMGDKLNVKSLARANEPAKPSPDSLAGLVDAAAEAWTMKEFERSLDCLQRAHRLAPMEPRILLGLGRYYGLRCNYEASQEYFEKAFQATGQKTDTIVIAGEHSAFFGKHDLARRYFQRALDQVGDMPDALVPLAELHERQQQTDVAAELVERALHVNRSHARSLLTRARLYRATKNNDEAEKLLLSFVHRRDVDYQTVARGWNELGMLYDRVGRYDEAFGAFEQSKSQLRPRAEKQLHMQKNFQRRLAQAAEMVTPEDFRTWHEAAPQFTPAHRIALLCGHPRSGTTLLEQVLDAHPGMVSSEETMIFFNEAQSTVSKMALPDQLLAALREVAPPTLQTAREKYFGFTEKFFGQPVGDRLLIDKNPSYTAIIPAFTRIFPESKYLIALRDPRDVCLSCYMQWLPVNPISATYLDIGETVAEYASLMSYWLAIRPKLANPWLEVRYEDMVDDLDAVAHRALEFLEIPWDERVLAFNEHAKSKIVRSPTYADVGKPIYKTSQGRWRHYEKFLAPHLEILQPFVKAFGYE